jgi:X-Pro dipeptidyl-peptidase
MPAVTSQTSDNADAIRYIAGPEPRPAQTRLYLGSSDGSWSLTTKPQHGSTRAAFTPTGTNTESFAATHPFADAGYLGFASAPLKHDIRLFGRPVLHLWSTTQRQWVTVTPSLVDFDPSKYTGSGAQTSATDPGAAVALTRGWLDSRYRDGLDHEVPTTPSTSTAMNIELFPTDYTVRKGHRLVLLVQSEDVDWAFAKPYPVPVDPSVQIDWSRAQTWLSLPIASGAAHAFG